MPSKADFYEKLHTNVVEPWDYSARAAEQLRYQWVCDFAKTYDPKGQGILDVGCSLGQLSQLLIHRGLFVSGVDISEVAVEKVKMKMEQTAGRWGDFKKGTADRLPFEDQQFQLVLLCDGVAEWGYSAQEKQTVLREVHRVLRPGGYALFTDFTKPRHFESYVAELKSNLFSIPKVHYFNDRLWFQLATNLKSLHRQNWCRALLKSQTVAKGLATLSARLGPTGSKHIGVVLQKN